MRRAVDAVPAGNSYERESRRSVKANPGALTANRIGFFTVAG